MRAKQQQNLHFDGKREQDRPDMIERLWGDHPQVKTVAHLFDEQAEREATRIAHAQQEKFVGSSGGPVRG